MQQNKTIQEVAAAWNQAKSVVVFTGAGMSTESGLPDFRSKQGLWKQRPESLATLDALRRTPNEFYFFYQWRIRRLWEIEPNAGHNTLAILEQKGKLQQIVTQNVDGLHQRSGNQRISELHGTLKTVSCLKCRRAYDNRQLLPVQDGWEEAYQTGSYQHGAECFCPHCQGNLRPDVVLFGEALPEEAWQQSLHYSRSADLFIVIGSSLLVSPANVLPRAAVEAGSKLLILNQDETPLDSLAHWRLFSKAAETLPVIAAEMERQ